MIVTHNSYKKTRAEIEPPAEDDIGIEVHVGKDHGENFECGLCEFVAKDLEALEIHLCTCEIYKCEKCADVFKHLSELKTHFVKYHEKEMYRNAEHIKQNRDNKEVYDTRTYKFEDLFQ